MKTAACRYAHIASLGYVGPYSREGETGVARSLNSPGIEYTYVDGFVAILAELLVICPHGPVVPCRRRTLRTTGVKVQTRTWSPREARTAIWPSIQEPPGWYDFLQSDPFPVNEPAWLHMVDYRKRLAIVHRDRSALPEGSVAIRALFLGNGPGFLLGQGLTPSIEAAWWGVEGQVSYLPPVISLQTIKDVSI